MTATNNKTSSYPLRTALCVLVAALALAACCQRTGPAPEPARQQPATAPAKAAASQPMTPVSTRALPPMKLSLAARQLDGGELELTATITTRGRLPAAPVLRVVLPEGATLRSGVAREALEISPGSTDGITRVFRVAGAGQGTIRVVAEAAGPAGGARSEASYPPAKAARPAPPVSTRPLPPTKVKGVTLDRAVPLKTN